MIEFKFLSTLSLRRATCPCWPPWQRACVFLSTLSLRRATADGGTFGQRLHDFYPRSPCGERRGFHKINCQLMVISIHALLAESDPLFTAQVLPTAKISIHALLAESDTISLTLWPTAGDFYPRSPCGERPIKKFSQKKLEKISIHALLAESDQGMGPRQCSFYHFYPRSPCGERLGLDGRFKL